jgi:hypothetical protein
MFELLRSPLTLFSGYAIEKEMMARKKIDAILWMMAM